VGEAIPVASLRPIRTACKTLGGHILEHPSCGGFMPTAETTLIPASSINQRASKKSLTGNARLDNEANLFAIALHIGRHSIEFIDENGGGPGGAATKEVPRRRARSLARDVAEVFGP
jgi:hypothetical protein